MLTLITPTGARPEALALCDRWMQAQTDQNFEWVVLDDGPRDSPRPERADLVIRPYWRWDGKNTQHKCLLELLRRVGDEDPKLIIEDDDYYSPGYVAHMRSLLSRGYGMVGEHNALYYHVGTRTHKDMSNRTHASLCSTGFQGKLAHDMIRRMCERAERMVDMAMWKEYTGSKKLVPTRMSVGIKGLPGRAGIGCGHKLKRGVPDRNLRYLRATIGADADVYEGYYRAGL